MTELEQLLTDAQRVPVTDTEHWLFSRNVADAIAAISERTGIPLSSGRMAYAHELRCLFIIN